VSAANIFFLKKNHPMMINTRKIKIFLEHCKFYFNLIFALYIFFKILITISIKTKYQKNINKPITNESPWVNMQFAFYKVQILRNSKQRKKYEQHVTCTNGNLSILYELNEKKNQWNYIKIS